MVETTTLDKLTSIKQTRVNNMRNRLAIVTGATSGIGKSLANEFAKHGIFVFAIGRDPQKLEALTQSEHGQRIIPCQCDITSGEQIEAASARLKELSDTHDLNYLVHNATILDPIRPLTEVPSHEMKYQMDVNVTGPMALTNSIAETFKPGFRMLFISTGASRMAVSQLVPHCAAKAAQAILAQGYRDELKGRGVLVNIIEPGIVNTPSQERVRALPESILPFSIVARKAFEEGNFMTAEVAAKILFNFLSASSDESFASQWPWRFSNVEHFDQLKAMGAGDSSAPGHAK
jgi:benzil reductase ((S)-benzoin forming)